VIGLASRGLAVSNGGEVMRRELVRRRVPKGLEGRLEAARLELLALFRAIDELDMSANELPQGLLQELFGLDGDYAEALSVLDSPVGEINVRAMLRDTRMSLARLDATRTQFLEWLLPGRREPLEVQRTKVRATLTREDAYHSIPGMDPKAEPSSSGESATS